MNTYVSFTDYANRYTLNIVLTSWVPYSPADDLVSSGGTCLGPTTNNLVEYHALIGLLAEVVTTDASHTKV